MAEIDFRNLECREYISKQGLGASAECDIVLQRLRPLLNSWLEAKSIAGFTIGKLQSEEDIAHEDLEELGILTFTNGVLPVVWINITYAGPVFCYNRDIFERDFDLVLVDEARLYD